MFRPRSFALLIAGVALGAAAPVSAQPVAAEAPAAEAAAPGPEAPLSDRDRLARGKALYEAGDYSRCVAVLEGLLGPNAERTLPERNATDKARLTYAACLLGMGQPKQADVVLRQAIRESPQLQPNPLEFPRPVVDRFAKVRKTMLGEIERADRERAERARKIAERRKAEARRERDRQEQLLKLASEQTLVVENSRWLAAVPFGVGQFQNRSPVLGWLFLTTELAALGTTVGGAVWELELHSRTFDPTIDRNDWNQQMDSARTLWTVGLYSFAGLGLLGILEAQLSYEPKFERTVERPLPHDLRAPATPAPEDDDEAAASPNIWLAPMAHARGSGLGLVMGGCF